MSLKTIFLKLILGFMLINTCTATHAHNNKIHKELILNKATIIEMVIYTIKDTVDESQHLQRSEAVGDVLAKMPGFVSRNFAKSSDGKWVDLVYWENLEFAEKAAQDFMTLPETQSFIADINESDMQFLHTSILSSITPQ